MRTARGHRSLAGAPDRAALAIGNFDGVHVGHQQLFRLTVDKARRRGAEACVLTFDPHPARVLAPQWAPPLIVPLTRRLELIAGCGIDLCVVEPFDQAFAAQPPEAFVQDILVSALQVREVVVGYDFTYGQKRQGTAEALRAAGRSQGFEVTVLDKVTVDGLPASSSKVRELVLEGHVDGAARLLGRPFELGGEVVRGAGRGRTLGIPTANLRTDYELLPRGGVYAGYARLSDGSRPQAVINVGTNPTFSQGDALSIEAHLLDWEGDLYGQRLVIELWARLRPEERFPGVEALLAQIRRDIAVAKSLLATIGRE
jgi:riboflavin kinase/FMN adenylyltransferase